jgi:hypothetical protein
MEELVVGSWSARSRLEQTSRRLCVEHSHVQYSQCWKITRKFPKVQTSKCDQDGALFKLAATDPPRFVGVSKERNPFFRPPVQISTPLAVTYNNLS